MLKTLMMPLLAAALLTVPAAADARCAPREDFVSLKVAEVQQRLMVAAYTCHEEAFYNRFVLSHRSELRKSDKRMLRLFLSRDGGTGDDEYNAFKTRLANVSSLESNEYPGTFCYRAREMFTALDGRRSLASFAQSDRDYTALPFESCAR